MSKFNTAQLDQALAISAGFMMANHMLTVGKILQFSKKAMKQKNFKIYTQTQQDEHTQPIDTYTKFAQDLKNLIAGFSFSPFHNGQLLGCRQYPLIECYLACTAPLNNINQNHYIDESMVQDCFLKFQYLTQTRDFYTVRTAWEANSASSEKQFDNLIKNTWKHVNGMEMLELTLSYPLQDIPAALRSSLRENFVNPDQIEFIVNEIRKAESDRILAISSKLEMTIHNHLKLRLIIFLEREFIDDPEGFTDPQFYSRLKYQFELNSINTMTLETLPLNGFLMSNKLHKQLPLFKDQIQLIKVYLVGTETLLRVGGIEPTFSILYSKYKN
ncbi:hypothetical protein C9426_14285 [Serratia sp. S1B]|nr:hypothetical protein C9426_14285 [Serratia sp. S1B]